MRARTIGGWLVGVFAGLCALTNAEASLVKSKGSPPLVMPNTLLVEAGEQRQRGSKAGRLAPAHHFRQPQAQ